MKLRIALAALTLASAIGGPALAQGTKSKEQPAQAEPAPQKPGKDWMTEAQVTEKLKAAGYSSVEGLEAYNGKWEGSGVKNGKPMVFDVDPKSGKVLFEGPDEEDEPEPPAKKAR